MSRVSDHRSTLRKLAKDERGSVLLQFTIFAVAMLGMVGLALDGSRYFLLNNDLQDLADASAIAGAAELDYSTGARQRATDKANNLLTNNPRWSDVAGGSISVQFFSGLNPDTAATSDQDAKFIKVTTGTWQIMPTFLVTVGAVSNSTTKAVAVAGAEYSACVPIQSFLCGPNFPSTMQPGTMMSLLTTSGSTTGNWGLIDVPGCGSNPSCFSQFFAQTSLPSCSVTTASQRTGNSGNATGNVGNGVNVRFDQPISGSDPSLSTSAPLVIDGFKTVKQGNTCNVTDVRPTIPDPKNKNKTLAFDPTNYSAYCNTSTPTNVSCPLPRGTITNNVGTGTTVADLNAYWKNHYGSASWPTDATTGQPKSRYQVYQQEVGAQNYSNTGEQAGPQCSATVAGVRRRVLSVAVIDTCPTGNSGGSFSYSKYADFFITEPVDTSGSGGPVYVEYINTYTPGSTGSALHRIVKLYR